MAWGFDSSLAVLVQQLVDTRLRVERIKLLQKLQRLEERISLKGVPPKSLNDLRTALQKAVPLAPDRVDRELVLPRKSAGVWRRRYLSVKSKPGSVF